MDWGWYKGVMEKKIRIFEIFIWMDRLRIVALWSHSVRMLSRQIKVMRRVIDTCSSSCRDNEVAVSVVVWGGPKRWPLNHLLYRRSDALCHTLILSLLFSFKPTSQAWYPSNLHLFGLAFMGDSQTHFCLFYLLFCMHSNFDNLIQNKKICVISLFLFYYKVGTCNQRIKHGF